MQETAAHIPGKLVNVFNGKMIHPFLILLRKSVGKCTASYVAKGEQLEGCSVFHYMHLEGTSQV